MTAREFMRLLANHYENRNELDVLSVGHWTDTETGPRFHADVAVSVKEIRQMAGKD